MNRYVRLCTRFLLVLFLVSCKEGGVMDRLDQIKHVGDSDPATALAMLDSLEIEMRAESEYTRNKYKCQRKGAKENYGAPYQRHPFVHPSAEQ